jgi:hypothetical protein
VQSVAQHHLRQNMKFVDLCKNLKNKAASGVNHLMMQLSYNQHKFSSLQDIRINT